MAASTGARYSPASSRSPRLQFMSLRNVFAVVAIAIGLVGLALDFHAIMAVMTVSPQNPVARSFPEVLVYYFTFLTNLSNTAIILTYLAALTGWGWLGWFRSPV